VRVLDALKLTSPSVGGPLDLYVITPDGVEHRGDDDLGSVRDDVVRWTEHEQRVLDELFD
jgi:proteasome beta subunit